MILSLQVHITVLSPSLLRPKLPVPGYWAIPYLFGNPAYTFVNRPFINSSLTYPNLAVPSVF